ncbi:MAG TPA: glutamine synthetase family protein [Alphaproteobacteria bacterium]|nr:glutamine synthetase family protein [Alphaproteobacteria bacterium]
MDQLEDFIRAHRITEVECLVPDMSGIARGKIVPADKLLRILRERGLRIPEAVFIQTVTGEYPNDEDVTDAANGDVYLSPDMDTIRIVPWYTDSTAQVICDATYRDGRPVDFSTRHVLRRVVKLYEEKGWKPIIAPELEFFLVEINKDPDYPLVPPVGRSGRQESGRQAFGIDAVNEFDPIFEQVYDFCEAQEIDVDTLTHEVGAAQIEINFNHGDPLSLADQTFMFKRTVREAALKHGVYATFMAKPMKGEPGSAMHIHQSLTEIEAGRNLFADENGNDTQLLLQYIAGLQKYIPAAMPLMAPNVNSYRRLIQGEDAPINVHWGQDNRTAGLRVPVSTPQSRRVENRVAGADANPYLAIAASLACGYLGIEQELEPTDPVKGSAHRLAFTLPRHQFDALNKLNASRPLREILGERFIEALTAVKEAEYEAYQRVISSWERENLLLNV